MIGDIVRRYAALPVPRYTSYPTAAEFSPAVTMADHARWLHRVEDDAPISIYLHVPYCSAICHYCGCHAKMAVRDEVIDSYRVALETELALVAELLPGRLRIGRLHWGGGTPSILGADGISSVMDVLHRNFTFASGFEHAIELDPRHVGSELARHLADCGINRASLGVQDVDPTVQTAIGREQPVEVVQAAFDHLRQFGIDRINVDLIYGLPRQTARSLIRTCTTVGAMGPSRIACYGYAHLPDRRANQRRIDAAQLPTADERFEQSQAVAGCFAGMGYSPIGTDHFALPDDRLARAARAGRLRRNFQGYTDDDSEVVLAFGASAISRLPDGFVQNTADNGLYRSRIGRRELASVRGTCVTARGWRRARIIEQLMCNFEVDLDVFDPQGSFADEWVLLRPLAADGLVVLDNRKVRMTALGKPIVRVAAAVFDQFRRDGSGGFSPAI